MWLKHCKNYSLENNTFPFLISLTSVIFCVYIRQYLHSLLVQSIVNRPILHSIISTRFLLKAVKDHFCSWRQDAVSRSGNEDQT